MNTSIIKIIGFIIVFLTGTVYASTGNDDGDVDVPSKLLDVRIHVDGEFGSENASVDGIRSPTNSSVSEADDTYKLESATQQHNPNTLDEPEVSSSIVADDGRKVESRPNSSPERTAGPWILDDKGWRLTEHGERNDDSLPKSVGPSSDEPDRGPDEPDQKTYDSFSIVLSELQKRVNDKVKSEPEAQKDTSGVSTEEAIPTPDKPDQKTYDSFSIVLSELQKSVNDKVKSESEAQKDTSGVSTEEAIVPKPDKPDQEARDSFSKVLSELQKHVAVVDQQDEGNKVNSTPEVQSDTKDVPTEEAIPTPDKQQIPEIQTNPNPNLASPTNSREAQNNQPHEPSSKEISEALSTVNDDVLLSLQYINNISSIVLHDSLNLISQAFTLRLDNLTRFDINNLVAAGDNDPTKKGLWIKGLGSFSKQKPKEDNLGYKSHHQGIVIGIDTELKKEVLTAGIAYTNTFSNTKFKGISLTNDNLQKTNLHVITLYGQYVLSPKILINANLNYGKAFIKTQRNHQNILYLGKTKGDLFRAGAEASYKADYDKIFTLLPKVGITFDKFSINSFKETSSALNFKVGRKSSTRVAANIGARIIKCIKMREFEIAPGINLDIEQTVFSKSNRNTITTISNQPQTVVSEVVKPSKTTYTLGTFLSARKTKSIELNLGYDYIFRRRYYNHSAYASVLFKF